MKNSGKNMSANKYLSQVTWGENSFAVAISSVPNVSPDEFKNTCVALCSSGIRLAGMCTLPQANTTNTKGHDIVAVLADDKMGKIGLVRTYIPDDNSYVVMTPELPQAHLFERELLENHGIKLNGHPWPKPVRKHNDLEKNSKKFDPHPFLFLEGQGCHEVAVGPVHAGVIEPGHFRFQCHGEIVYHLEIQLGYQHRGAEALFMKSNPARRLAIAESICGDTAMGHSQAYCMVLESLAGIEIPPYAQAARGIALELERMAWHVGDMGALCIDIGFQPGASFYGRLRAVFLNLLMRTSGNRFGKSLIIPGGVRIGFREDERKNDLELLALAERDLIDTNDTAMGSSTVCARFENCGVVTNETAETIGLVGPAGRASNCNRDVRRDHPFGIYRKAPMPVALYEHGDVMGRYMIRWLETMNSSAFVQEQLANIPDSPLYTPMSAMRADSIAVAMTEGWRGEIVHIATTDKAGDLSGYKFVDPSFHNWFGLAWALRDNEISDFPVNNKSFNLSYAGYDL